jgi:hypothetical protein
MGQQQIAKQALSNLPIGQQFSPMANKFTSQVTKKYNQQNNSNATPESNFQLLLKIIISEINGITELLLSTVADELNLDLNQSNEMIMNQLKDKLKIVVEILKSDEVRTLFEETFNEGLEIYMPLLYKAADSLNELAEKEVKIGVRIVNTAITEIPIVFFMVEIINFLTSLVTALKAVAQFVPAIADSIKKIEDFRDKLINSQNQLELFIKNKLESKAAQNNHYLSTASNPIQHGGILMKKLLKEKKLIGGSIEKSRADFLNPNLTLSQLIKPHKRAK